MPIAGNIMTNLIKIQHDLAFAPIGQLSCSSHIVVSPPRPRPSEPQQHMREPPPPSIAEY
jgi:hypothetical protein